MISKKSQELELVHKLTLLVKLEGLHKPNSTQTSH
jgi:hypothetical protein